MSILERINALGITMLDSQTGGAEPTETRNSNELDTAQLVKQLVAEPNWSPEDHHWVELLATKLDITKGKLRTKYSSAGKKTTDQWIADPTVADLIGVLMARRTFEKIQNGADKATQLKCHNTLFKALDHAPHDWCKPGSDLGTELDAAFKRALDRAGPTGASTPPLPEQNLSTKKTVPLTILFYEGPIARAYLATMAMMGIRARKLIRIVPSHDVVSGKPVGQWLPRGWRAGYAQSVAQRKIHHWPQQLLKTHAKLVNSMQETIGREFGFTVQAFSEANKLTGLESHAEKIETVVCHGLGSDSLFQHLRKQAEGPVLFTGGGIVPRALLEIPQLRMLHVHPGFLPHIRGSDCLLWSTLIAGQPSATCFYMAPGIDTGDVILPAYLPRPNFDYAGESAVKTLYRAVYSFLDPWVRSFVLAKVLEAHTDLMGLIATPQSESEGTTFYFMHDRVRAAALDRISE